MNHRPTERNTAYTAVIRLRFCEIKHTWRRKKPELHLQLAANKSVRSAVRRILSRAVLRNAVRNAKKKSDPQYVKEKYETLRIYVPKGQRDGIKAYAQSQGLSVNKLLLAALEEYRNNHE